MRKHRTKIIAAVIVLAVLAGAWFMGGTPDINEPDLTGLVADAAEPDDIMPETTPSIDENTPEPYHQDDIEEIAEDEIPETNNEPEPISEPVDQAPDEPETQEQDEPETQTTEEYHPDEPQAETETITEIPVPVEPEDEIADDGSFIVTLEIRVDMLLPNMHLLNSDKHELVPDNGVIFPRTEVTAYEGESVFNVLQRETRRHRIHMASRFTPVLNSAYIEAINNIYEFDAGSLSGWVYSVNGWFPNFGSSRYQLSPGDVIEWHFSLDLGRDLGMDWVDGGQLDD